jgi:c-di-GMP-binding flagellar brake protein YcgR
MKERRKYLRFAMPLDVEYRTLTLNPIFGKTLAKDLSREGVRVGLKEQVSAGTPLEVCLNVPGDNLPVFAIGKVAWADGLEAGVKLTRINENDRDRVLEYVYQQWLKSKRKT